MWRHKSAANQLQLLEVSMFLTNEKKNRLEMEMAGAFKHFRVDVTGGGGLTEQILIKCLTSKRRSIHVLPKTAQSGAAYFV